MLHDGRMLTMVPSLTFPQSTRHEKVDRTHGVIQNYYYPLRWFNDFNPSLVLEFSSIRISFKRSEVDRAGILGFLPRDVSPRVAESVLSKA